MESQTHQNTIKTERLYHHDIQSVWNAISDQEAISDWFIQADFECRVGYNYTFTHEQTVVTGEVLEVEPPRLLVYTWVVGGTTAITTVRWILSEKDEGTLLVIEHSGFDNYADAAPSMFNASVKGWGQVFAELEGYLKK